MPLRLWLHFFAYLSVDQLLYNEFLKYHIIFVFWPCHLVIKRSHWTDFSRNPVIYSALWLLLCHKSHQVTTSLPASASLHCLPKSVGHHVTKHQHMRGVPVHEGNTKEHVSTNMLESSQSFCHDVIILFLFEVANNEADLKYLYMPKLFYIIYNINVIMHLISWVHLFISPATAAMRSHSPLHWSPSEPKPPWPVGCQFFSAGNLWCINLMYSRDIFHIHLQSIQNWVV